MAKKRLSERSRLLYNIAVQKETLKRHIQNYRSKEDFAREQVEKRLPNLVSANQSGLIKRGKDIDPELQYNKAENIEIAASHMNGLVIKPGQTFSFWDLVGKVSEKTGYKAGRVIVGDQVEAGMGGGLCNLANSLHLLILDSPMEVTEFHHHSDALAPDHGKRVPFATGTSVAYNYVDYRFKNTSDQDVQLAVWCADETLYAELRSEHEFPYTYKLIEEDHHFRKEGEKYFRVSKIYRESYDRKTGERINLELLLDNHSEVMFDYNDIPKELIRD